MQTILADGRAKTDVDRVVSDSMDLIRCSRCVMPETQEAIEFDSEGVCNTCRSIEAKHERIDWEKREKELLNIFDRYRGKYEYDCLVPFSGGKDSTFTAYILMKKYGLRPLIISFDHHMLRPKVLEYRERTLKRLGADFLAFKPNWHVVKKMMRVSLERKGDVLWYQHNGIFAYPMQIAIKFNIPLVIWGEPTGEYCGGYYSYKEFAEGEEEEVNEERFNKFTNLGITAEDMYGMINSHPLFKDSPVTMQDIASYIFPRSKDLRSINCKSICLGSYIPWDVKKHFGVIREELGWQGDEVEGVPPEYCYEKVEDMMQGIQDWLKFIKRGYGRMSHLASIDIRNDRMTRDEGMKLLPQWEGLRPASLDLLLEWISMTEDELYDIVMPMAVYPWKFDRSSIRRGPELPDQKYWVVG